MTIDSSKAQKLTEESEMLDDMETPKVLNRTNTYNGPLLRKDSQELQPLNQTLPIRTGNKSRDRTTPALTRNGKLIMQ